MNRKYWRVLLGHVQGAFVQGIKPLAQMVIQWHSSMDIIRYEMVGWWLLYKIYMLEELLRRALMPFL